MYIEYRQKNKEWDDFGGCINPPRNDFMFGVICEGAGRKPSSFSFSAKGMPSDAAFESQSDNQSYTLDGRLVTNTDWHHHSWLSTQEFQKAIEFYRQNSHSFGFSNAPEYEAILASMKRFEELGFESRLVFWFDN